MRVGRVLGRTSTRTFAVYPVVVLAEAVLRRRRLRPAFLPLLAAGHLLYDRCGGYRTRRGGGGPGIANPPDRLVTTGPFARSRNPMYLGHLMFLGGLALAASSPLGAGLAAAHVPWFQTRVRDDERRLRARFGAEYDAYRARTPRWLGRASLRVRPHDAPPDAGR